MDTQPTHPRLKAGWVKPEMLSGYDTLAACYYGKNATPYAYELEYFNSETVIYASETIDIDISYPWENDFEPTPQDWKSIGFEFHDCH